MCRACYGSIADDREGSRRNASSMTPPRKRRRSATSPSSEQDDADVKAAIRTLWAWEEHNGRRPDIESIFDFLKIDQTRRYELLKSDFVRTMASRAADPGEFVNLDPRDRQVMTAIIVYEGVEVDVKLYPQTPMSMLFKALCGLHGKRMGEVDFCNGGFKIFSDDTAKKLGIQEGDYITMHNKGR